MRICYALLSPTFGMHQYTADYANRMAGYGHDVHLLTTTTYPADRYAPAVTVHTPITTHNTGFTLHAIRNTQHATRAIRRALAHINPDLVHFTGPHLWNPLLLRWLRRQGIPAVHSLHDLDPHKGAVYGRLLYGWNALVVRWADHVLVHGACYRRRLLEQGLPPERVTSLPLLHLFLGHAQLEGAARRAAAVHYEPWALFFGRLERYKGVEHLLAACAMMGNPAGGLRAILAGPGSLRRLWDGPLPSGVELRQRFIGDEEALDLFCRCGLVVLPYIDATQSALVSAAYYFHKPVVVTRSGALPEYVRHGETGWVVAPGDAAELADCLRQALADPARLTEMGRAGRAWYDEQRALEEQSLLNLYSRVLPRSKEH